MWVCSFSEYFIHELAGRAKGQSTVTNWIVCVWLGVVKEKQKRCGRLSWPAIKPIFSSKINHFSSHKWGPNGVEATGCALLLDD